MTCSRCSSSGLGRGPTFPDLPPPAESAPVSEVIGLHLLTYEFCVYACFDGPDWVLLGLFVDDMSIIGKVISVASAKKNHASLPRQTLQYPAGARSCTSHTRWYCGLLAAGYIPVFNEIPGKAVIKKQISQGTLEQVALMTETKAGRLTLDC